MFNGVALKLPLTRLVTIVMVVLIVIAGILGAAFVATMMSIPGGVHSTEMEISPPRPLVGEPVTFEAIPEGESPVSFHWDFGDGNTSEERTATHTFNRSDEYWIELQVVFEGGSNVSHGTLIGVQNHDVHEVLTGSRISNPSRGGMPYDLIYFDIYDGITRPNVTGHWAGTAACRELDIFIMTNPTSLGPRLVSEDLGRHLGDFDYSREAEVPEDGAVDCQYIMVLQVIGGTITDYRLELTVEY